MAEPAPIRPKHIDLEKAAALTVYWSDGRVSRYSIAYLRRMSPSADARELRQQMKSNPLTVLPDSGPADRIEATDIEMVGNYAVRITFSDGHHTGLYSWDYLRRIDPELAAGDDAAE